jgi:hypothetical protein
VGWSNSGSASFDCFGQSIVWLGMVGAPLAEKCDQAFHALIASRERYDSDQGPPGFD